MLIGPGRSMVVQCGVCVEIPPGFVGLVCPRSGLAANYDVTVLNAPGIVDSGYRGEFKVILINHGAEAFEINRGDRIAQLLIVPVAQAHIVEADELSDTARGAGGFGSTGVA